MRLPFSFISINNNKTWYSYTINMDFLIIEFFIFYFFILIKFREYFYRIDFSSGIEPGKTAALDVDTTFTHSLKPYPAMITQAEKQYVVLNANLYLYSPYKVASQSTTVTCASSNVEFYTKKKPVSQAESAINYGPYLNKEPFSEVRIFLSKLFFSVTIFKTNFFFCEFNYRYLKLIPPPQKKIQKKIHY